MGKEEGEQVCCLCSQTHDIIDRQQLDPDGAREGFVLTSECWRFGLSFEMRLGFPKVEKSLFNQIIMISEKSKLKGICSLGFI